MYFFVLSCLHRSPGGRKPFPGSLAPFLDTTTDFSLSYTGLTGPPSPPQRFWPIRNAKESTFSVRIDDLLCSSHNTAIGHLIYV